MLKLALSLVFVVGLVLSAEETEFRWETIPVAENASQCIYRPEVRTLGCRGVQGLVECPAVLELGSGHFEVFGIRRSKDVTPVESRIFELYPRKLDNQTYENYTVIVDEKPTELNLYFAESKTSAGIRVTDKKCYIRLVQVVLDASKANHEVPVTGLAGIAEKVELFGEVLIAEKPNNKRWLGFGFPWLGFGLGMWGWGLGWGLPFWG